MSIRFYYLPHTRIIMMKTKKTLDQEGLPVLFNQHEFRKAGCLVFTFTDGKLWVLTVTSRKGVLSPPKGGVEEKDVVENSPWATLLNAGIRELKEETGVVLDPSSYHLFDQLILEINENNPTGKLWNIAYSVCVVREKVPLCGEEGKGTVAWLPVTEVLSRLELAGARSRKEALETALVFFNHASAF